MSDRLTLALLAVLAILCGAVWWDALRVPALTFATDPGEEWFRPATQAPGFRYRRMRVTLKSGKVVHVVATHYVWDAVLMVKDAATGTALYSVPSAQVVDVGDE